jgi:hypothetical protein
MEEAMIVEEQTGPASGLEPPDWEGISNLPDDAILAVREAAILLRRDKNTISMHARNSHKADSKVKPIGQQVGGSGSWIFTKADIVTLAEIALKGAGRPPTKFLDERTG